MKQRYNMDNEVIIKCQWCHGDAVKLFHRDCYAWRDDFSFDQRNKVKIFICQDCGRVMFEDFYANEE